MNPGLKPDSKDAHESRIHFWIRCETRIQAGFTTFGAKFARASAFLLVLTNSSFHYIWSVRRVWQPPPELCLKRENSREYRARAINKLHYW